jgi:hypothetical protein
MVKKVQIPTVGGIRKVIQQGGSGTTIAELGNGTVTLSQLAALIAQYLGVSPTFTQPPSTAPVNASATGINITPDTHPWPELSVNDEFEYGTSIDTTGARWTGAAGWNSLGINTSNISTLVTDGALVATITGNATITSTSALSGWYQAVSGTTWAYSAKIRVVSSSPGTGTMQAGLFVCTSQRNVTSASAIFYALGYNSNSLQLNKWSWSSSIASAPINGGESTIRLDETELIIGGNFSTNSAQFSYVYLQVFTSGSFVMCAVSIDGMPGTYSPYVKGIGAGQYIGFPVAAVQNVGLGFFAATTATTQYCTMVVDWFRKTS